MKRSFLLAIGVALVVATGGCSSLPAGGPPTASSTAPPAGASPSAPSSLSRTAAIYTAVLRRYLTSGETSHPGTFRHVYVWTRVTASASDPMRSVTEAPAGDEIAADDRASITGALADQPIQFVESAAGLFESPAGCAQIRDGILITLGPPEGSGDDVTVAISGFYACEGATWLTYAVRHDGDDWQVTGPVGSMAIA